MSALTKSPTLPPRVGSTKPISRPSVPSTPRHKPQHSQRPVVFSWNYFLCPVAWIQRHWKDITNEDRKTLARLDRSIVSVLLHARTLGPVYVLCEGGAAFVETLCRSLFPECAMLFSSIAMQEQIKLVCAATPISPTWHGHMLQFVVCQRASQLGVNLTVFGQTSLRNGCAALRRSHSEHTLRRIKMIQTSVAHPTVNEVLNRLEVVQENLALIVAFDDNIDSVLSL
ncbi:unnamed protein product [Aphanomyces euteiches]|uniref:Uncharacterized protein n=1 Tax=Aphanomyces euteiches TaxID=100861 RepID=A0A6G0XFB7_9STRA|nr:hypothetical protein Ae201684_005393 [Aphanomyces euteiches]KAH9092958.1 hypothetical protein Ae201684P_008624 [Aphanomyces euteiches]KAH9157610.1 hypothetical protein AeRB84_000546 [Aphanomyces euteiches]